MTAARAEDCSYGTGSGRHEPQSPASCPVPGRPPSLLSKNTVTTAESEASVWMHSSPCPTILPGLGRGRVPRGDSCPACCLHLSRALMDLSNLPRNIPRAGGFTASSQSYFCSSACLCLKNYPEPLLPLVWPSHPCNRPTDELRNIVPAAVAARSQTLPAPFGLHFSRPSSPLPSLFSHRPRSPALQARLLPDRPRLGHITKSGCSFQPRAHPCSGLPCSVPALQPSAVSPAASPPLDAANQGPRPLLCQTPPAIQPLSRSARGLLPAQAEGSVSRSALGTSLTQQTTACSQLP